jgi:SAM-dependent methyltransferase
MSIDFYDRNAEAFFSGTVSLDVEAIRARFLGFVPAGGRILDAGCGSGRDALAFHRAGYDVSAFDGSHEMVRLAREHTGLPVQLLTFDDLDVECRFDGIWASASLLHVPRPRLPSVMASLARALRPAGAIYVSMKRGDGDREVEGRLFVDVDGEGLTSLLEDASLTIVDAWTSNDVRPERAGEEWVNAIALKAPGSDVCST